MINYPIKFKPILREKIWGGSKLKDFLKKETKSNQVGESWEISGVKGDISVVENGVEQNKNLKELISEYKGDLVGKKIFEKFGDDFPLLVKFIDAKTDLSVQLHPNDELASRRHNSFGKTEMWYVLHADEGSKLNIGFKKNLNKNEYLDHLQKDKLVNLLNFESVQKGDSVFINTGKVHAIGAGVLLAEIQQTSDITYRIFDWNRVDEQGKSRELHTELALEAIDFDKKDDYKLAYENIPNSPSEIASCEYFTTNFLPVRGEVERDFSTLDSFIIYMCVEGKAIISLEENSEEIKKGETVLIPAFASKVKIQSSKVELLEVYI